MSQSKLLLLFDVDGVVTDEHARVDTGTVERIIDFMVGGARVGFITGRSRTWLEAQLVPLLEAIEEDTPEAVLAAEMGAVRFVEGEWLVSAEHAVVGPARSQLRSLADQPKYSAWLEWDSTKEATATFEALHDPATHGHAERARNALAELMEDVRPLATRHGYRAALSTYALDVLAPSLSKAVGAEFAIDALRAPGEPRQTVVFGDSTGDLEMAVTARSMLKVPVTFVWLGQGAPPALPDASDGIALVTASEPHAPGTRGYLATL
ncbi:MAG: hypothetical protein R3C29_13140 [Dehalococcoidia bacterium]